jgi:hypothetical protein
MDRASKWKDELESGSVSLPMKNWDFKTCGELTERVESFLLDWDTYDHVREAKK